MLYTVTLNCTVEQSAELHVEASSPEEAAKLAQKVYEDEGVDWKDADGGITYGTHEVELPLGGGLLVYPFTFQDA